MKTNDKRGCRSPRRSWLAIGGVIAIGTLGGCATTSAQLERYEAAEKLGAEHLAKFDTLDFDVFTNQKWERLQESHSKDIKVYWPDGHVTTGIEKHIEDLKAMFVYAPDIRIKVHSVKIAGGSEWTSVIGELEGTFTKPMPIGEGKTVAPTHKPFKILMCTVGHWTKESVMDEEYLFWDNATFMKQIGLGQ
jgi:hypothetical protein